MQVLLHNGCKTSFSSTSSSRYLLEQIQVKTAREQANQVYFENGC